MVTRNRLVAVAAVAVVGVVGLILAAVAFFALQPGLHDTATHESCSPRPCAAPQGFAAYFTNLRIENGVFRTEVTFRNNTKPDTFEAVSYRHTSPADFLLKMRSGTVEKPTFDTPGCPDWSELHVQRGSGAGPEPICFPEPAGGVSGASIVWSPDLGLLFRDVTIPLGTT